MKHTSPTSIEWCTSFKCFKARIELFPEKLQQLHTRKAMLQKTVVHFTAKATKHSVIIKTKFLFVTFSSHPLLFPFSILLLCMGFLPWWYIPLPLHCWLVFYSASSVHVSHPFSLYVKFCTVSSVMESVFCPTDILLLQEKVRFGSSFPFFYMPLFFPFLFLKQAVRSKLKKSVAHTCKPHHKSLKFYKQVTELKLRSDWYFTLFWLCMFTLCVGREEELLWINSDFLQCVSWLACAVWHYHVGNLWIKKFKASSC